MSINWAIAKWDAPMGVQAFTTSRTGGSSVGSAYSSMNLSYDVGDNKESVNENRQALSDYIGQSVPFLKLEHSTKVIEIQEDTPEDLLNADAAIIRKPGRLVGILTADCLPVFFSNREGSIAAIAHAGWRGLAAGILDNTVKQIGLPARDLVCFIGPAIHAYGYYVGREVYDAFMQKDSRLKQFFWRSRNPEQPKRAHCDLRHIAKYLLNDLGILDVEMFSGDTYRDIDDFFSYRRMGNCGRMASVIYLKSIAQKTKKKYISLRNFDKTIQGKTVESVDFDLDF